MASVAVSRQSASPTPEILRAISALAVIKVNWDESKDHIANFVPIVAHSGPSPRLGRHARDALQSRISRGYGEVGELSAVPGELQAA